MNIEISNEIGDIDNIVDIHMKTFDGFFLTFLGKGFLKLLYKGFQNFDESDLIVAKDNGEIVGFLAYSNDMSKFYKYLLKSNLFGFAWYAFIAFLKKPKTLFRLLSAFGKSNEVKRNENYVELASIGVNPLYKGKGIGSDMIEFLINIINFDIYDYISLETDSKNNESVNKFYIKNGFLLYRTYETKQGREMNEYHYKP